MRATSRISAYAGLYGNSTVAVVRHENVVENCHACIAVLPFGPWTTVDSL